MNLGVACPPFSRSLKKPSELAATGSNSERGYALASVLLAITALSMMAASLAVLTSTSFRSEQVQLAGARAEADWMAAVNFAVLGILDSRPDRRWRVDGVTRELTLDDTTVTVSVQDELGRIDVNTADRSVFESLFAASGLNAEQSTKLVDNIVQWRSRARLEELNASSEADYARLGYRPRHGPFQTIGELKFVIGMTNDIFSRVAPALTVYTKVTTVDAAVATREALLAVGGNDPKKVEEALHQRIDAASRPFGRPGVISPSIPLDGRTFEISGQFVLHGRRYIRSTIVEITGDPKRPYLVLAAR